MIYIGDNLRNGKIYNGNTLKFGVTLQGVDCIVKFPRESLSVFCEYIASKFIRSLGIPCHDVTIGVYQGNIVNIIKDFTSGTNLSLHSFKDTKQSSEDTEIGDKEYTYSDVVYLIEKHLKLTDKCKDEAIELFWDMFICDAILANRDRHWGNWGYLSNGFEYRFAPLYDNGSSLFPSVSNKIQEYINPNTRLSFLHDRIYIFPASLLQKKVDGRLKRTNFCEMFSDLRISKVFAKRVARMKSMYTSRQIFNIIYNICFKDNLLYEAGLDFEYRRFFVEIVTLRYKCIILREPLDKAYKEVELWLKEAV